MTSSFSSSTICRRTASHRRRTPSADSRVFLPAAGRSSMGSSNRSPGRSSSLDAGQQDQPQDLWAVASARTGTPTAVHIVALQADTVISHATNTLSRRKHSFAIKVTQITVNNTVVTCKIKQFAKTFSSRRLPTAMPWT